MPCGSLDYRSPGTAVPAPEGLPFEAREVGRSGVPTDAAN